MKLWNILIFFKNGSTSCMKYVLQCSISLAEKKNYIFDTVKNNYLQTVNKVLQIEISFCTRNKYEYIDFISLDAFYIFKRG